MSSKDKKLADIAFVDKNAPGDNNVIIVLGCQVTDLAILNDIRTVERLHEVNPKAKVYMGGCLAYRFDIELPEYVHRLAATRVNYQDISKTAMMHMHWARPFWIRSEEWYESDPEFVQGHLFRDMYPLKIGAGCNGQCKYCTIRHTRGETYEADAYLQVKEFLEHDNVVLISDSPTVKQIKDWAELAKRYNKPISIRNVEPTVTVACKDVLYDLASNNLLYIFHCPIQSNDPELLREMNRNAEVTEQAIQVMIELRKMGVKTATNIIIDYTVERDGKEVVVHNMDEEWLNNTFYYWSWNPYFDGKWDRKKAEERFNDYITKRDKS